MVMPPVPTGPIYFEPPVEEVPEEVYKMTCIELDNSIRYLHPYTYSYKPDYYLDKSNQIANVMLALDSSVLGWLGLAYLSYSGLVTEKETRRLIQLKQKVAVLQRVKAEKSCFES
jgi:hypothetical protein